MAALIGVALVMLVSIVGIFVVLVERQKAVLRNERTSAIWATYQFEKEGKKLRAAVDAWLLDRDRPSLKDVGLRFDVLFSSLTVVQNSDLPHRFPDEALVAELLPKAVAGVTALTPAFDALPRMPTQRRRCKSCASPSSRSTTSPSGCCSPPMWPTPS